MIYRLIQNLIDSSIVVVQRLSDSACIPFDTANSDYQTFKQQINDETAQLEDADGNLMTPEEAKAYVATLP